MHDGGQNLILGAGCLHVGGTELFEHGDLVVKLFHEQSNLRFLLLLYLCKFELHAFDVSRESLWKMIYVQVLEEFPVCLLEHLEVLANLRSIVGFELGKELDKLVLLLVDYGSLSAHSLADCLQFGSKLPVRVLSAVRELDNLANQ